MSSYIKNTKNPKTGKFEPAYWLDDYFGSHKYGVKFEDGKVYDPAKTLLETNQEPTGATWEDYSPNSTESANPYSTGNHTEVDNQGNTPEHLLNYGNPNAKDKTE